MSFGNIITFADGSTIPQIGLGTWMSKPKEVENAVSGVFLLASDRFVWAKGVWKRNDVWFAKCWMLMLIDRRSFA